MLVLPDACGKRIATQLLKYLMSQKKWAHIHLEVSSKNQAAQHAYKKVGFETVGLRPNYYGQGIHGIMMAL